MYHLFLLLRPLRRAATCVESGLGLEMSDVSEGPRPAPLPERRDPSPVTTNYHPCPSSFTLSLESRLEHPRLQKLRDVKRGIGQTLT